MFLANPSKHTLQPCKRYNSIDHHIGSCAGDIDRTELISFPEHHGRSSHRTYGEILTALAARFLFSLISCGPSVVCFSKAVLIGANAGLVADERRRVVLMKPTPAGGLTLSRLSRSCTIC